LITFDSSDGQLVVDSIYGFKSLNCRIPSIWGYGSLPSPSHPNLIRLFYPFLH